MTEKTKHILTVIGGWFAFLLIFGAMFASPMIYLELHSGSSGGRQAVCMEEKATETATDLRDIALHLDYWNYQPVSVFGKLSYSSDKGTFYVRDGIFMFPVDGSDCQGLDRFEIGETPVALKATVAKDQESPILILTDLREAVPGWVQVLYEGGAWGAFFLGAVGIGRGIGMILRWFFTLIGVMSPKPAPSREQKKRLENKKAGITVLYGIMAPLLWLINPFLGGLLQVFALIFGRKGLQSEKRTVEIVGIVLCGLGLVVMTIVTIGTGGFGRPLTDLYSSTAFTSTITPAGDEPLEIEPYVSEKGHFSFHVPRGWTVDESEGKSEGMDIYYKGPDLDTVDGKPTSAKIGVYGFAAQGAEVEDLIDLLVKSGEENPEKNFKLIGRTHQMLSGGRMDATYLEATGLSDEEIDSHYLIAIVKKTDTIYMIASSTPSAHWDEYAQTIRKALASFEAWDGAFAACLKAKGAVMYGTVDCPYCEEQKEAFTDGIDRLPFVQCDTVDGEFQLIYCYDKDIDSYPTWVFSDDSRLVGSQTLKALSEKTSCEVPK